MDPRDYMLVTVWCMSWECVCKWGNGGEKTYANSQRNEVGEDICEVESWGCGRGFSHFGRWSLLRNQM
jgi:hypothetical protein